MATTKTITDDSFEIEVLKASTPVLVDFWAKWCGPCRALAPKLEEVASEMGSQVKVVKLNVDENPNSPGKCGVRGLPTMILFKGGQQVDQLIGNLPKEKIMDLLQKHI